MHVEKETKSKNFEPRWPVAVMILAVTGLLAVMPGRIRIGPVWAAYVLCFIVLIPVIAAGITKGNEFWTLIERRVIIIFFIVTTLATLGNLANLTYGIIQKSTEISGLKLLISSLAVWVSNVFIFSLLYWQLDRDGPEARVKHTGTLPDWIFPEENVPSRYVPTGWHPTYIDYLFLSFSTATAFSTTDIIPLKARAKLLMMLESSISLTMIAMVVSRAINILGN